MAKVLTILKGKYDAAHNVIHLEKVPQGVEDREQVYVTVAKNYDDPKRPWLAFSMMSEEDADDFARVIEEMFPIEK